MNSILRGSFAILALFFVSSAVGGLLHPRLDQSVWLVNLQNLPIELRTLLLLACGAAFGVLAVQSNSPLWVHRFTSIVLLGLVLLLLLQSAQFYALRSRGAFQPGFVLPLTLVLATLFALVLVLVVTQRWQTPWNWKGFCVGAAGAFLSLPLAQMFFFGTSDYRRQASAILVFGARTYADGRMSDALTDRMRTAVQLFHENRAGHLIVSGGPGDGAVHETEAMRDYAIARGVPVSAIEVDRSGVNTEATAKYVGQQTGWGLMGRVLAVSHDYHLPRVKMALDRQGVETYTVPARESYTLHKKPYFMAREIVALWAYYLSAAPRL